MPQYLLSVCHDDDYDDLDLSAPETQRQMARTGELTAEMKRAGAWVFVAGLRPASSATVVRSAGGDVSMTDGPYAETKEQVGGYYIVDCPNLDEALACAKQICALYTFSSVAIEVRPVMNFG